MKVTLTQNQQLFISALISMILTALASAVTAMIQTGTGKYDIMAILSVGLTVFGTTFGVALYRYIPANIQTELDALRDTQAEIQRSIQPTPVVPPPAEPVPNIVVPPPNVKS